VLDRSSVRAAVVPALLAAALLAAAPAHARGWATPAAGGSASGDPEVLFTFDDGPNPRTTGQVLDILAARGIQAVFFMVGWRFERSPDRHRPLLERMVREGHVVANHTMTHAQLCRGKEEAAGAEIDEARAVLEREARMPVPWFRTPYGAWCPRLPKLLDDRGLRHVYWDIDPQEWKTGNARATEERVIAGLRRLQGRAVVLLHDTKVATVQALPRILDWIDAENARRTRAGGRPIRIVGGSTWARELLGEDALAEAGALAEAIAAGLAGGLASALP
jgi:peptidoglycan/xylan/chitin deacetylase (PgdA/CDA1 family)